MIGTSDGQQHEDEFSYLSALHGMTPTMPVGAAEKPVGEFKSYLGTQVPDYDYDAAKAAGVTATANGHWPDTYKLPNHITFSDESIHNKGGAGHWEDLGQDKWSFTPGPENLKHHSMDDMRKYFKEFEPDATLIEPKQDNIHVDRTKDVPLAASALHKDGEMYGIAIDKDAPHKPEYDQYIYKHEADEFAYMKDLIKNGMSPTEAYPKAHDHITPMESARVQADLGEKGLEDYKQYWRDVASVSTAKETADRHPDAHTTTYGLDEHELGRKFSDGLMHLREFISGKKQPTKEELNSGKVKIPSWPATIAEGVTTGLQAQGMSPAIFGGVMAKTAGSASKWFKGADGKPRFEIPDSGSKIRPASNMIKEFEDTGMPLKLPDILEHPELYKAYPHLEETNIRHEKDSGYLGHWDVGGNTIYVSPNLSKENLRSTLMHEIQHAVQDHEGFDRGTNPKEMLRVVKKAAKADGSLVTTKQELDLAEEAYRRSTGEVEARNVQRRLKYPLASKMFSPEMTEDVSRSLQIPTSPLSK